MTVPHTAPPKILMLSLHGYVGAEPELGLPDTGGQVVFVLELAKQFRELGHAVDIVTRRFEDQPEVDDMGGNLRVGLEDSLYLSKGHLAQSNADQVRKLRRILEELSLEIASPDEVRARLQLKGPNQVAF